MRSVLRLVLLISCLTFDCAAQIPADPPCWSNSDPQASSDKLERPTRTIRYSIQNAVFDRSDWRQAIEAAAATWSAAGLPSRINFQLVGSAIVGPITSDTDIAKILNGNDNLIASGNNIRLAGNEGYLAITFFRQRRIIGSRVAIGSTVTVIEENVENGWRFGQPSDFGYDLQSDMLHEFGHWLGLQNIGGQASTPAEFLTCFDKTIMWWGLPQGTPRRTLLGADFLGIASIYPP